MLTIISGQYELKLASDPTNILKVESLIEKIRVDFNINEDIYGNILVAITEAVNNAIIHGNQNSPDKLVKINFRNITPSTLEFTISDEGEGFDHEDLPDPTAPENLEKLTGRGVFLIKNLSDKVEFEDNGSTVRLFFNI